MANYELMLITNPNITDEERTECIGELKDLFTKNSVTIEKEDIWGDKKLAYKINKSDRGFYHLYDLNLDGKLIKVISKSINLNTNVWRYMFVKQEA